MKISIVDRHNWYVTCKKQSRQAIESMNELVAHVQWMVEEQISIAIYVIEDVLNEVPMSLIDYQFTSGRFGTLLA